MGMCILAPGKDLRCVVMQPQSGLRATVSKIRVYKVDGQARPASCPREVEGRISFTGMRRVPAIWDSSSNRQVAFRCAPCDGQLGKIMADAGASLLMPTVNIYQPAIYPSAYNPTFTDSNTFDSMRLIELTCENIRAQDSPGSFIRKAGRGDSFRAAEVGLHLPIQSPGRKAARAVTGKFNFLHQPWKNMSSI